MQNTLSTGQLAAVRAFAEQNGRTWKAALRSVWETGNYSRIDAAAELQQVRNAFGPRWLIGFNFKREAFDVVVRRIATGADFSMRLFCLDADDACAAAKDRARFAIGMRKMDLYALEQEGTAVFRVVSCTVSADQSRPISQI